MKRPGPPAELKNYQLGTRVQVRMKVGDKYEWVDGIYRNTTSNGRFVVNVDMPDGTKRYLTFAVYQVRAA